MQVIRIAWLFKFTNQFKHKVPRSDLQKFQCAANDSVIQSIGCRHHTRDKVLNTRKGGGWGGGASACQSRGGSGEPCTHADGTVGQRTSSALGSSFAASRRFSMTLQKKPDRTRGKSKASDPCAREIANHVRTTQSIVSPWRIRGRGWCVLPWTCLHLLQQFLQVYRVTWSVRTFATPRDFRTWCSTSCTAAITFDPLLLNVSIT